MLSPRFGSPQKIENKKIKTAEKEPWAEHLSLGENIGSGGCNGLLHFSI
jgi:hypothetical protein